MYIAITMFGEYTTNSIFLNKSEMRTKMFTMIDRDDKTRLIWIAKRTIIVIGKPWQDKDTTWRL